MSNLEKPYLEGRAAQNYVEQHLKKLAGNEDSWSILYADYEETEYWELSYPDLDYHGGGIPVLKKIDEDAARKSYKF